MHIQDILLFIGLLLAVNAAVMSRGSGRSGSIDYSHPATQFATFTASNRSYSMSFSSVMTGQIFSGEDHCNGRLHNAPQPLFSAILTECSIHGDIIPTVETAQPTNQLLVASGYYNCGQDFIWTDRVDVGDDMQRCIQHIEKAAIQRGFGSLMDEKGKPVKSKISAAERGGIGRMALVFSGMLLVWRLLV